MMFAAWILVITLPNLEVVEVAEFDTQVECVQVGIAALELGFLPECYEVIDG